MTNSEYQPDDTRRLELHGSIGMVCIGSTGRLGIVTHVAMVHGDWAACGFGLDGKGVWTSGNPHQIATASVFFNRLAQRFNGRLSYLDTVTHNEMDQIADRVREIIHDGRVAAQVVDALDEQRWMPPPTLKGCGTVDYIGVNRDNTDSGSSDLI